MHQPHRVSRREGQPPRHQLVERHSQRVQVRPVVHRAVHPPRLLRRDVRQRPLQHPRPHVRHHLARQLRGDAEVNQLQRVRGRVVEDVRGVDVLVDDAPLMDAPERLGQPRRELQEEAQLQRPRGDEARQRPGAEVLQHERQAMPEALQCQGLDDARPPGLTRQPELIPQAGELLARRVLRVDELEHHPAAVRLSHRTVEQGVPALEEPLPEAVSRNHLALHVPPSLDATLHQKTSWCTKQRRELAARPPARPGSRLACICHSPYSFAATQRRSRKNH